MFPNQDGSKAAEEVRQTRISYLSSMLMCCYPFDWLLCRLQRISTMFLFSATANVLLKLFIAFKLISRMVRFNCVLVWCYCKVTTNTINENFTWLVGPSKCLTFPCLTFIKTILVCSPLLNRLCRGCRCVNTWGGNK